MIGRFLIALIHVYQFCISSRLPRVCRFEPGCSTYMIEAIQTHGILRGVPMGLWRICRCNPWGGCGYDPVPGSKRALAMPPEQEQE